MSPRVRSGTFGFGSLVNLCGGVDVWLSLSNCGGGGSNLASDLDIGGGPLSSSTSSGCLLGVGE